MAHLGLAELGVLGGDGHVAAHHQLQPAGEREPVDGGDNGDRRFAQQLHAPHVGADVLAPALGVEFEILAAEIETGGEGAPGAGQDDGAHVGIGDGANDRRLQGVAKRLIHRVHLLGPVHGQDHEGVGGVLLPENRVCAHLFARRC